MSETGTLEVETGTQKETREREEAVERAKPVVAKCIISNVMARYRELPTDPNKITQNSNEWIILHIANIIKFAGENRTIEGPDGSKINEPTHLYLDGSSKIKSGNKKLELPKIATDKNGKRVAARGQTGENIFVLSGRNGDMYNALIPDINATVPIHINELILAEAANYPDAVLTGMHQEQVKPVAQILEYIREPRYRGELPSEGDLAKAEAGIPHIGKLQATDAVIQAIQAERRAAIRRTVPETVEGQLNPDGSPGQIVKRSDEDVNAEIEERFAKESADLSDLNSLSSLVNRLMNNEIQDPKDLARATLLFTQRQITEEIDSLQKKIIEMDIAKNQALNDSERLKGLGQSDIAQERIQKMREIIEEKRQLEKTLKMLRESQSHYEENIEVIMSRAQRGEYSESMMDRIQKMLKENTDPKKSAALALEGSQYKTIEELMADESIPKDKKELIQKLIEVGGPVLYLLIMALLEEMRKQAKS